MSGGVLLYKGSQLLGAKAASFPSVLSTPYLIMRPIPILLPISLFAGFTATFVSGLPETDSIARRQEASILNNPDAQPDLPSPAAAAKVAAQQSLNLDDIQGDILVGMKKKTELFVFFHINNPTTFKKKLKEIKPMITSTTKLLDVSKQPKTAVNIAFSKSGLNALGITEDLGDSFFSAGQFADAGNLGDPGTGNWVSGLKGTDVHGVFIFASNSVINLTLQLAKVTILLAGSVTQKHSVVGQARPGSEEGHEHFGFMDGISQPGVTGFTANPLPGQVMLSPGTFLLGESGDAGTRPSWAKGGSFLAFRQLKQLVPEFDKFLDDNAIKGGNLTKSQGSALLGARMVGRWKSGAPIDLSPLKDDPALAADPKRNNDFTFVHEGSDIKSDQSRCPFSAHVRKTRPRADLGNPEEATHHIIRAGIPYGPEVNAVEKILKKTLVERGLAFVAYQSNLASGFRFLQQSWANNPKFIFGKNDTTPGLDPIIGAAGGADRTVSGLDPFNANRDITMKDFIVSRGGEYFFSPPISALVGKLSA